MQSYTVSNNFFGHTHPEELAQKYGTPLYVYNESILRQRMKEMKNLITCAPFTVNYSIKTNSNISILKIALDEGLNADAMSPGEIHFLLEAGFPAEKIFYVSNNVSEEELQFAIDRNIMTSLDSVSQLDRFGRLNPGGTCAIRLNPGVGAGHHEKVVTAGKKTKFSIAQEDIDRAIEVAQKHKLKIVGVNQHIGSLFLEAKPFIEAVKNFLSLAERFNDLEFVDFGGGFGIPYKKLSGEPAIDLASFSSELDQIIADWTQTYGKEILFKIEPGRFIAAEGGVLLGRVHAKKQNAGQKYVGTDLGMNVLIRPMMYDSWHDIEVYRKGQNISEIDSSEEVTVVGNICETGDIIADGRLLPRIEEDDIVCILDAGAYGFAMASNYNNRLKPAEVLINLEGEHQLIRRRQTFDDLLKEFPGYE